MLFILLENNKINKSSMFLPKTDLKSPSYVDIDIGFYNIYYIIS